MSALQHVCSASEVGGGAALLIVHTSTGAATTGAATTGAATLGMPHERAFPVSPRRLGSAKAGRPPATKQGPCGKRGGHCVRVARRRVCESRRKEPGGKLRTHHSCATRRQRPTGHGVGPIEGGAEPSTSVPYSARRYSALNLNSTAAQPAPRAAPRAGLELPRGRAPRFFPPSPLSALSSSPPQCSAGSSNAFAPDPHHPLATDPPFSPPTSTLRLVVLRRDHAPRIQLAEPLRLTSGAASRVVRPESTSMPARPEGPSSPDPAIEPRTASVVPRPTDPDFFERDEPCDALS
ncbi:hypothetical protein TCAP_00115 [Tolypocladium capitatum]|uniref:Uncharacterized protein n=1 Tax=Tolypocladium capitatum TaxID=45235 RepID=A0A2K3QR13_9HYPO|nr:hypothetical protein TCAP_00115 [Tolypocladium capitatum]